MKAAGTLSIFAYLAVSLTFSASQAESFTVVTRGNVQKLSTDQFRQFAWPYGNAPIIAFSSVKTEGIMWPPGTAPRVELFEAPIQIDRRVCRRVSHILPLTWENPALYVSESDGKKTWALSDASVLVMPSPPRLEVAIAIGSNCKNHVPQEFARVSPEFEVTAISALKMLDVASRQTKGFGRLGFTVECQTASGPNRCAATGRGSLSQMSIQQVWNIQSGTAPNSFQYWVGVPGQLLWEVTIFYASDNRPTLVSLASMIPSPF